ncbi:hypothetical protein EGC76_10995 [Pseudidiomarina gelatinasegens]|uniref:Site-specific integrase n=1 Tax=Pseudidiomarina gelatinasegens TaxID=2487740 RepID=A0A443YXX5_9GAMM|nr:hypothetical protein [Pseudidiomarina gelatinasegens]RWU08865.1 hypothetical protein EGC76_10995 [Pseudidiomarina gelatinasegens]
MDISLVLPDDFAPDNAPTREDVISLFINQKWEELDRVIVCTNKFGEVTARFGDEIWDCSAYAADQGTDRNQRAFIFSYLKQSELLLRQVKLIIYGWLFEQGHNTGARCKLSTLTSRFNTGVKKILLVLEDKNISDISSLNDPDTWRFVEEYLHKGQYSKRTLELAFTGLRSIENLNRWLPFEFEIPFDLNRNLAIKLACQTKLESKQTLAIPQSIANVIFGEALKLVEMAWPYCKKLAQLDRDLQSNYDAGRAIVDYKINTGIWKWLSNNSDQVDAAKTYAEEINKATPRKQSEIILQALSDTPLLPVGKKSLDGTWFSQWRSSLQSACFICCGAFTGMRVSELFELRSDSFSTYMFEGQTYHSVRAATHKLAAGKKTEEWLASPVVEKAIDLATALSSSSREQLLVIAAHTANNGQRDELIKISSNLWLSQHQRKNLPILISRSKWNDRLRKFSMLAGTKVTEASIAETRRLNPRDNGAIDNKIEIGKPWPLITHQFRRTFACFSIRNNLGNSIALKQQFKHVNLRMTEWYGNGAIEARLSDVQFDSELKNILNEVAIESTTNAYFNWFNGSEPLSGSFGKAILAMREDTPTIYSSWESLYRLVKENRLTLHGTLHSYCKNGYDCDMEGIINPAFCVDCKTGGSVIDTEKAKWWQKRHFDLVSYLRNNRSLSLNEYAHCITQVRAAERVMSDFNLSYESYQHPIEVIDL